MRRARLARSLRAFVGVPAWILAAAFYTQAQTVARDFALPTPLYAPNSAWNQMATGAAVLPESDQQILILYRVLRRDNSSLHPPGIQLSSAVPFMFVNYDNFSVPVSRMGRAQQTVRLRNYAGNPSQNNPKLPLAPDGTVAVPAPAGVVRPAGPENRDADGHLVLYDPETFFEYDLWQATTVRDVAGNSLGGGRPGTTVLEAGAIDFFDVRGPGANPRTYASARATGTPLLAGMILPEDIERGTIRHALDFAIPGPRNTNVASPVDPPPSDYFYPASTTEANFFNTNPLALAAGQRIRLKQSIVDSDGNPINETQLAPITRTFLEALRTYGAYLVDNSGSFSFTAEDIHTAVLHLSASEVNRLIGHPSDTALPADKTSWQVVIETLNASLERIPLAFGPWQPGQDPRTATITVSNFEVVQAATVPPSTASPVINEGGIVNGASFAPAVAVAAGSIASVFGTNLASSTISAGAVPLPTTLGGATLQFNLAPAVPKFFASNFQINIQIPWELAGQPQSSLTDTASGVTGNAVVVNLAPFSPGLFAINGAGSGQGAIVIAATGELAAPSGSVPGRLARPANRGESISIFCTGLGDVNNRPASGAAPPGDPLSTTKAAPAVTIGAMPAAGGFSGLAPFLVGLYQVNVQVPPNAPMGNDISVVLTISGVRSNAVTIAVQ